MKQYIKINEEFSYTTDRFNWILIQFVDGFDKNGKPKKVEKPNYYGKLGDMLNAILDKTLKQCESLVEVRDTIDKLTDYFNKFEGWKK